ncbi:MAG: hypothetical protein WCJ64_03775 [Rhodospirillaceae bacterium]
MESFWKSQLDYVFFVYGLSFILFGYVCFSIRRLEYGALPWTTLAYFGFIHGTCEWLDLLAISLGDNSIFSLVRLLLKALSFILLFVFCLRTSSYNATARNIPLIVAALIVVLLTAITSPLSYAAVDDMVRWSLALPGCLWASLLIYRAAVVDFGRRRTLLLVISGAFACYGLLAGATVPNSEIVTGWMPSHNAFLAIVGVPVQVFRALFATIAAAVLWGYEIEITLSETTASAMRQGFRRTLITLLAVSTVGWAVTYFLGMVDTGISGRRLIGICSCLIISLQIMLHYAEVKRRFNIEIDLREKHRELEYLIGHLERMRSETPKEKDVAEVYIRSNA